MQISVWNELITFTEIMRVAILFSGKRKKFIVFSEVETGLER